MLAWSLAMGFFLALFGGYYFAHFSVSSIVNHGSRLRQALPFDCFGFLCCWRCGAARVDVLGFMGGNLMAELLLARLLGSEFIG